MTTQFTQLISHWEPDEAQTIIQFLDELRDQLWRTYGDEIIQQQRNESDNHNHPTEEQLDLVFNDRIPF